MSRTASQSAKKIWCGALLIALLTGCYRMPTDDDYSLIPTTNNPDITRECGTALPSGGF